MKSFGQVKKKKKTVRERKSSTSPPKTRKLCTLKHALALAFAHKSSSYHPTTTTTHTRVYLCLVL